MLLCVPGFEISIYSTGRRASGALMRLISSFIRRVVGGSARIVQENQEQLRVSNRPFRPDIASESKKALAKDVHTSTLNSYPASVKRTPSHRRMRVYII